MAPEMFLGEIEEGADYCVDLWAFGVIIYELFTKSTPFFSEDLYNQY